MYIYSIFKYIYIYKYIHVYVYVYLAGDTFPLGTVFPCSANPLHLREMFPTFEMMREKYLIVV